MDTWKKLEESLRKEIEDTGGSRIVREDGFVEYRTISKEGQLGDFATEWWDEKDWEEHRKCIKDLEKRKVYGKPFIFTLILKEFPEFDYPNLSLRKDLESYKMEFIDYSKNESSTGRDIKGII